MHAAKCLMKPSRLRFCDVFWLTLVVAASNLHVSNADEPVRLTDEERIELLKPEMTLAEVQQLFKGKWCSGLGCGAYIKSDVGLLPSVGRTSSITYKYAVADDQQIKLTFTYLDGIEGYLRDFNGPGFRYDREGKLYIRKTVKSDK